MARRKPTTHPFVDDPDRRDPLTGQQWCMCGLPYENRRHDLPQRTDEQRALEARKVGERGDQ